MTSWTKLLQKSETDIESFIGKIIGGITKIFDTIVLLTVIPVLVFYFLNDYEKIKSYVKSLLPERYQAQCSDMIHAIDKSLGGYIRGQFIICFFVGFTTYIAFQFLGIKYPLLLAIIMGLTNIIPYFGPIIGAIPVLAITITISTKLVIYALIAIFIIQLIEGNLLSPYIVGKSTAIHPIIIIFVLLLGGQISGVLGMIFAVPILTIIKVMTNHVMTISRKN
ncbi:AI-2E family transporter [Paracerasibacillus soli]